ncbi:hypothetical protein PVK06_020482 [Gossypium arboreum]|uniref:Uncharacterized protein n=1 Tax=Gossypium arboreum TaxID=29729 RepID=A0ABR0PMW0_GOSAR|nr:hypothetical protein PVK06_020482 [Gossypium arboreum]
MSEVVLLVLLLGKGVQAVGSGSMKFTTSDGEIGKLFPWHEHLSMQKFPYSPADIANLVKNHEKTLEKYKRETLQSFRDYLPDLRSNFLLHAQVVGDPFDAYGLNFDALSDFTSAQLDFDVHFPSEATWEEFLEKVEKQSLLH